MSILRFELLFFNLQDVHDTIHEYSATRIFGMMEVGAESGEEIYEVSESLGASLDEERFLRMN